MRSHQLVWNSNTEPYIELANTYTRGERVPDDDKIDELQSRDADSSSEQNPQKDCF